MGICIRRHREYFGNRASKWVFGEGWPAADFSDSGIAYSIGEPIARRFSDSGDISMMNAIPN
jgi:hypothetical protein